MPADQLAGLASTSEVLAALQRAHTAKRAILSNAPPLRVDTQQLPDQSAAPPSDKYRWSKLSCRETAFSSCGRWLAVALQGEQWWWSSPDKPEDHGLPWHLFMYEVVLYSTSGSFQQQTRFPTGEAAPVLQWAASEPHLCIAQLFHAPPRSQSQGPPQLLGSSQAQTPSKLPAALMVDAPTGAVLHSLGPEASAEVHAMAKWSSHRVLWSPACTHLLVCGATEPNNTDEPYAGCLCLVDVAGDRVLASCAASFGPLDDNDASADAAAWHPQDILLSSDVQLADAAAFQDAGFAVGVLPQHFYLDQKGSVVDGGHLVARHTTSYAYSTEDTVRTWLSCHVQGQGLGFAVGEPLEADALKAWRLHGSSAPQMREYMPSKPGAEGAAAPSGPPQPAQGQGNRLVSPSGRFLVGKGPGGLAILDVHTREQLWDLATSDPRWSELTALQQGRAKHSTSLGLQAVLDAEKAARQLRASFEWTAGCPLAWGFCAALLRQGPRRWCLPRCSATGLHERGLGAIYGLFSQREMIEDIAGAFIGVLAASMCTNTLGGS